MLNRRITLLRLNSLVDLRSLELELEYILSRVQVFELLRPAHTNIILLRVGGGLGPGMEHFLVRLDLIMLES